MTISAEQLEAAAYAIYEVGSQPPGYSTTEPDVRWHRHKKSNSLTYQRAMLCAEAALAAAKAVNSA